MTKQDHQFVRPLICIVSLLFAIGTSTFIDVGTAKSSSQTAPQQSAEEPVLVECFVFDQLRPLANNKTFTVRPRKVLATLGDCERRSGTVAKEEGNESESNSAASDGPSD